MENTQKIRFNVSDVVRDVAQSVTESVNYTNDLVKIIKSSSLNILTVRRLSLYYKRLNDIIFTTIEGTKNIMTYKKIIKPANIIKIIDTFKLIFKLFDNAHDCITMLVKKMNLSHIKRSTKIIDSLYVVIESVQKFIIKISDQLGNKANNKSLNTVLNSLNSLKSVIDALTVIMSKMILLSALSILATPSLLAVILFLGVVRLFLFALIIFKGSTIKVAIIKSQFDQISEIVTNLLSIAGKIILFGAVGVAMIPALGIGVLVLFAVKLFLFAIRKVFNQNIFEKISIKFIVKFIDDIVSGLLTISAKIILLSVTGTIAIPAILVSIVFLYTLKLFINVLSNMFNMKFALKALVLFLQFMLIKKIIKNLISIALLTSLLAIVSIIAIPALVIDTIFILALTGFVLILKVLLKIAKIKFKSILALTLIIVVLGLLILIAIEIKKLNDIGSKIKWVNLFMILGGILLVAVFSILIGLAAMAIIPIIGIAAIGLVALIIVVGLLVLIAFALEYLQSIELNQDAIIRNVMAILECAEKIKELLFKSKENKEPQTDSSSQESKDALKDMGVADPGIIEVLAKFGSLFTTLLSVALISFIAGKLNDLQQLTLNRDAIMTNVGVVLDVSKNITNVLFDKPVNTGEGEGSEDNKSMIESLINFIGGPFKMLSGLLEAIVAVPILLTTILSVGMIYVIAKMLTKIVEIELDGVAIRKKINDIVFTAQSISDMVFGNYEEETPKQPSTEEKSKWTQFIDGAKEVGGKVWNATGGALLDAAGNLISGGVLGSLMPSLMSLNVVVDLIKGVQELEFDSTSTTNKINEIIRITKTISSSVSSGTGSIASIDEDKVEIFEDYVDSSIKYFKNINKLDVDKIKSIGDMYDKMGQFMEKLNNAPINDIADALVNKISPALSSIDESIGGNKNNKKSNNSTIVTTQATDQSTKTSKQIDYTGMLENIEDLLEQIKKKLNSQPQPAF